MGLQPAIHEAIRQERPCPERSLSIPFFYDSINQEESRLPETCVTALMRVEE
jgi:hypothetical protein